MPNYKISALMTVSCHVMIEAGSAEAALEIARAKSAVEWDVEKDGQPEDFSVEEKS